MSCGGGGGDDDDDDVYQSVCLSVCDAVALRVGIGD